MYFTIPSIDSELAKILGLNLMDNGCRRPKRVADSQQPTASPVKKRKADGFSVKLDVTHFEPEDIAIKVVGNDLMVTGKHGERLDENGFVSRQFTRRYELPKDIDLEKITSKMSTDGKLMIEAPLLKKEEPKERVIPITFAGKQLETTIEKSTEESEQKTVNAA